MPEVAKETWEAGGGPVGGNTRESRGPEDAEISQVRKHDGDSSSRSAKGNTQVLLENQRQPLSIREANLGNQCRVFDPWYSHGFGRYRPEADCHGNERVGFNRHGVDCGPQSAICGNRFLEYSRSGI